jgi:hypothetical protein
MASSIQAAQPYVLVMMVSAYTIFNHIFYEGEEALRFPPTRKRVITARRAPRVFILRGNTS